ncbi:uncharacterized protein C8A04DRAFT_29624 [Dichotomopilus funicola]|uniref:Uncharacterized protein n=1 Tax=Dichotomopilus funicola TaxID=1934379 RepID=A0AAN6ZLB5_9PEZI|nr:hypothetical protein C8A04DRAFT_29624 [Dichotomopilus funicola]
MRFATSLALLALATAGLALPVQTPAGASAAVGRRQVCNPFDWRDCTYNKSTQQAGPATGAGGSDDSTTTHSTVNDSIIEPEPPAAEHAEHVEHAGPARRRVICNPFEC